MKILYIDDSPLIISHLVNIIPKDIKSRLEIFQAFDGEEGLKIYKEHDPSIVFLDITMPKMNGFEVLERIEEINKETNVVVIAADRQQSTAQKVLKAGASLVLNKPLIGANKELYINLLKENLKK